MNITFRKLLLLAACALLTSCSTVGVQKEVVCRFAELRDAGKLPGFATGDHGRLRTQALRIGDGSTYPLCLNVYATREQDPAKYTYTFTKDSSSSEWRLTAAWRSRPDGQREDLKIE